MRQLTGKWVCPKIGYPEVHHNHNFLDVIEVPPVFTYICDLGFNLATIARLHLHTWKWPTHRMWINLFFFFSWVPVKEPTFSCHFGSVRVFVAVTTAVFVLQLPDASRAGACFFHPECWGRIKIASKGGTNLHLPSGHQT